MRPKNVPRPAKHGGPASNRAEREARAGTLLARVPDLLSLRFMFYEAWPGSQPGARGYVQRVTLVRASALFEPPCSNCLGEGVYALTSMVLDALSRRRFRFEGRCCCSGRRGTLGCTRTLRFVATATYRPGPAVVGGGLTLLSGGRAPGATARSRGVSDSSAMRLQAFRRLLPAAPACRPEIERGTPFTTW